MKQSINLYPESLRPKADPLSVEKIGKGMGILLLVLCAYSAYLFYDTSQKKAQLSAQQAQIEQLQQTQTQIEQELLASTSSQLLDQELAVGEQRLRAYQQLIRQLSSQQALDNQKFSAFLEALARQSVKNTWLTRIEVAERGERLALEGLSLKADRVPQWVLQMKQDPVFAGRTFASLDMQKTEESVNALRFEIASHLEADDESK